MAYPLAAGKTDIGSSTMEYIPTLYAGKLLIKFYETSVLSEMSNTDYEGMIREQGDTVVIRSVPDLTIRNHSKGMTLQHEQPESVAVTLYIDKGKYWAFVVDSVDEVQTDIKNFVEAWTQDAAYQLRNEIEQDVLQNIYADVDSSNKGATAGAQSSAFNLGADSAPVTLTKANVIDYMVDCGTVLDEQNVNDEARYFLLPPRICGLIKKSDLKDASLTGDSTSVVRNGKIGMIDRFTVYKTGNLAYDTDDSAWHCLFGHKVATTFATQLVKNESLTNPTGFGMLHRGLQVYGYKVVKPEAIGDLYATV
jgi:hypothetical protein